VSARLFRRYAGIDYSGAGTPETGLTGLRVYLAEPGTEPVEIRPENDSTRHWSRRSLFDWLRLALGMDGPVLVGLDHGLSFPDEYFERHHLKRDWRSFVGDFMAHWPTSLPGVTVRQAREGSVGTGSRRTGDARWRRPCEKRARAKSVFHFDVPGSVAGSTHAGLGWIGKLLEQPGDPAHFWPFDGWNPPGGRSVVAEAYPSLCSGLYHRGDRTPDQHDAYSLARWFEELDGRGTLGALFQPDLDPEERRRAAWEGWILGVG
jgi:hypothetical protein